MDKKGSTFDTSNFQSVIVKDIPQQMNGSDCGMFTCKVIIFSKIVCKSGANFRTRTDPAYQITTTNTATHLFFQFAEYLSRNVPITFSQEDMPYFRRRMIYEIVKNNLLCP